MCKYTSHEQYTACAHTIPCHIKYGIIYCHIPNGIPLPIQAVTKLLTETGFHPSRCCDMDTWRGTVLKLRGLCPACEEEAKLRARPAMESAGDGQGYAEMPNLVRRFECGHSKRWVQAASLQKCFVHKGNDGGEKKKKMIDIGEDFEIDMGDLRIAEFWETEYEFSEEETGKIQFEQYKAEGLCGKCVNEELKNEEEEREKGKGKKRWRKSRGLLGRWKRTFHERRES
ncbi:hypothetical protein ACJ73_04110 [Blastomyces percursus]|uniref:Uncharacterized protein n=1 Tax=Blastomyces percursus TaxID=1658174 RepID=A0A1J9Q705_9EURO|nr:hypothetical protein ACJ73_04110 [Blastomyces percursus]